MHSPWAASLSDLKHRLEDKTIEKVFEIYIKTTPERLWQHVRRSNSSANHRCGSIGAREDALE
jgi:hypothetical protein